MHQIENHFLRVRVREYGAELTSVFSKQHNIEHLWQADEKFWGWHAPVLFPVVGRCLNDSIEVDGKFYSMEKHGFARKSNFRLLELSDHKAVFSLTHNETTLAQFPFRFEFLIAYVLHENTLQVKYEVRNTDVREIHFQLGGHPAFAVPFFDGEKYIDYRVQFSQTENEARHHIDSDGFFDGRKTAVLNNSNQLLLDENMFADDALIFKKLKSRSVSICSNNHARALRVNFDGFNYLGLWAKVGAPYICIEPWLGCADTAGKEVSLEQKEGVVSLPAGESFHANFKVMCE